MGDAPPLDLDVLAPGSLLDGGRYRLGPPLGRGGFGITYRAEDLRLERPVAIKELFPERARREGTSVVVSGAAAEGFARARQRFLREATTLARFGHPSIVRIFAVFEEHGTAYLVLERLDGRTLAQELRSRRGPFSEAEALDVAGPVAAALSVVHRAGVLHRDVSPANLMRTRDGRMVLIDFGLARPFADDRTTAMTRIVTPGYAPPEQYAGAGRLSARADVYALGATLHRLLSGQVPPDAAARAQGRAPSPLWRVNPTVSRRVSEAVGAALALDADDRPPTVRDLLDRLGVATDDLDLHDPPDPDRPRGAAPGPQAIGDPAPAERPAEPPAVSPWPTTGLPARADERAGVGPDGPQRAGADRGGPDGAGLDGATRAVGDGGPGAPDIGVGDGAGPEGPTHQVAHGVTDQGDDPGWRPPDDRLAPRAVDRVTDRAAGSATTVPAPARPAAPERGGHGRRPTVRPASHVVPAPDEARHPASVGPAGGSPFGVAPPHQAGAAGSPHGRAWVTVPLGLGATALASAQPVTVPLVIGLLVAPLLATAGDRVLRPHRSAGWMPGWWLRNLVVGALRAVGPILVLGVGLGLWWGSETYDALAVAGPWVLRATGIGAGGLLCLSAGRGGPRFRSHLALDALARRLLPHGRLTVPAGVLLVVGLGLAAAGLWFQPEAWPLSG